MCKVTGLCESESSDGSFGSAVHYNNHTQLSFAVECCCLATAASDPISPLAFIPISVTAVPIVSLVYREE